MYFGFWHVRTNKGIFKQTLHANQLNGSQFFSRAWKTNLARMWWWFWPCISHNYKCVSINVGLHNRILHTFPANSHNWSAHFVAICWSELWLDSILFPVIWSIFNWSLVHSVLCKYRLDVMSGMYIGCQVGKHWFAPYLKFSNIMKTEFAYQT